ncbi:uncharacterized protein (TIGR02246 family) [Rubricella aquisinus]|uniref:Uncharacterized protein (TIGR02246 family) n=1 Tax=Rubricella aquisinus TaxID=2028108 RepID=A0A840WN93_9RHOB|nr:SgcJ/EcaC family oxidoreductase [Rubricella aquisinus]MBB5516071.1 uncharacterized protein (TIGR02246 family) [Rubricella aquisinus]
MIPTPGDAPHLFVAAWMARDAAALAALFAEDADFVNVTGLWWHDRQAIEKAHHYGLTTFFRDSTLRVGRVNIRDLGDVAVVQSRMHLSGQIAPDGSTAGDRQNLFTFVLHRQPGGWLIVTAQNTDIAPGKETHLVTRGDMRAVDYRPPR